MAARVGRPATALDAGGGAYRQLRGLGRALAILELIATESVRPVDVAQRLDLPWATVHRTMTQLTADAFLQRDEESGKYSIGPRMWFIGTSYLANHQIMAVAQPHLEALARRVEGTIQLCERSGRLVVVLFSHLGTSSEIITKATYGFHFPLHCGAKGRVLLAHQDPEFIDDYTTGPLEQLTEETLTDSTALQRVLAEIRRKGYAITEGDVQTFTGSVSAPVFTRNGKAAASIAVITRRTALKDRAHTEQLIEVVLSTARTVSMSLGWKPMPR